MDFWHGLAEDFNQMVERISTDKPEGATPDDTTLEHHDDVLVGK
jgi:hypothetical protein